ncbi:hypothetical protein DY000_02057630 [Brassica cretica]|uniref:Uncharacterized protein n=1 Tax=Brassica cretica TaxID=69181 RepID=A0ABQ7ACP1_BRACR|nr:hypothetical protein DY000_02057630 [Brassica cretica]
MRNIFDKRPNNGVSTKRQRSVPNAPVGEKIPNGKFYVVVAHGFQSADVTYVAATDGRNVAAAVANEFFILPLQGADLDKPSIMTLKS